MNNLFRRRLWLIAVLLTVLCIDDVALAQTEDASSLDAATSFGLRKRRGRGGRSGGGRRKSGGGRRRSGGGSRRSGGGSRSSRATRTSRATRRSGSRSSRSSRGRSATRPSGSRSRSAGSSSRSTQRAGRRSARRASGSSSRSHRSGGGRSSGRRRGTRSSRRASRRRSGGRSRHRGRRRSGGRRRAGHRGRRGGRRWRRRSARYRNNLFLNRYSMWSPFIWNRGLIPAGYNYFDPHYGYWYADHGYYYYGGLGYFFPHHRFGPRYGYWTYPFSGLSFTLYTTETPVTDRVVLIQNALPSDTLYFAFYYEYSDGTYRRIDIPRELQSDELGKIFIPGMQEGARRVMLISRSEDRLAERVSDIDTAFMMRRDLEDAPNRVLIKAVDGGPVADLVGFDDDDIARVDAMEVRAQEDHEALKKLGAEIGDEGEVMEVE